MKNKTIFFSFLLSILCWLLPFLLRIFFVELPDIEFEVENKEFLRTHEVIDNIKQAYLENDHFNAFILIFINNLKGCVLNVLGGIILGFGALFNLGINGFYSADIFVSSYKAGLSIETILRVTLPHSFELIGFWLSGAIGFYITWNIVQFMREKESFTSGFIKQISFMSLGVFFIILIAAYVEAYISIHN